MSAKRRRSVSAKREKRVSGRSALAANEKKRRNASVSSVSEKRKSASYEKRGNRRHARSESDERKKLLKN